MGLFGDCFETMHCRLKRKRIGRVDVEGSITFRLCLSDCQIYSRQRQSFSKDFYRDLSHNQCLPHQFCPLFAFIPHPLQDQFALSVRFQSQLPFQTTHSQGSVQLITTIPMKTQSPSSTFYLIWISMLISSVASLDLPYQPVSIVPNNTTILTCTLNSVFQYSFYGRSQLSGSYVYQFKNASKLPPGLSLTSAGRLFGRCQQLGNYSFTLTMNATGSNLAVVNVTYGLAILPSAAQTVLPNAYVGIPYSAKMTSNKQADNGIWSAKGIPGWLRFDSSTQTISGVPVSEGNSIFSIGYNSSSGYTETSFIIQTVPNSLTIIPRTIEIYYGEPLNITFTAGNGVSPYSFMFFNLPVYLVSDRNTLLYDGNCVGGSIINAIVVDSSGTANLFSMSVLCQTGSRQSLNPPGLKNINLISSLSSNLRMEPQSMKTQSSAFATASISSSSLLSAPTSQPIIAQTNSVFPAQQNLNLGNLNLLSFQSTNTQLPRQITQNDIITPTARSIPTSFPPTPSPPPFPQALTTLNTRALAEPVIINNSLPPRGLITGGICIPDIMLPQPFPGSGTISSINYNNSTITLTDGSLLKLQPCTQMIYSGVSTRFDTGNQILYSAQKNTTQRLGIDKPNLNPDILLSITNLN